jgi:uroporphyrinogen III methyltransferase/synthase
MGESRGKVFLIGAGPGAPDLITMRGARILGEAEVVIFDSLVSPELLKLVPTDAARIHAGKRAGDKNSADQEEINRVLVEHARAGKRVVRLKGGDPFIFGRGGEEAEALARAAIVFEIVPGVSSALAVPAFAGIPVTHRDHGSFVVIVTGHEDSARDRAEGIPWDDLARAAGRRGTLVILMATARMRATLARLQDAGLGKSTPAAAIQWGATAAQRTVLATVATLAAAAEQAQLSAPSILVVGECARLREELAWFERMPLFGRRIVVTRATVNSATFASRLRALGADVIEFATIATAPPTSFGRLDRALTGPPFDWIIFTSATGVDAFVERLRTLGLDLRTLAHSALAAIGPATAERLRRHALNVSAVPSEYRAEALIEAVGVERIAGASFLIPRAEVAREILSELLLRHGAGEVVVAPAYRTIVPPAVDAAPLRELLVAGAIDLITFTSSSTVTNFLALVGDAAQLPKAAAIGPITAATARAHGLQVVASPATYTVGELIDSIVAYFSRTL